MKSVMTVWRFAMTLRPVYARALACVCMLLGAGLGSAYGQDFDPPAGYYDSATGTGSQLSSQLHDVIDDHTVLNYNSARSNLQVTDADPDNEGHMILVYTNESLDLGSINSGSIPGWDSGVTWNREHTWPRSRSVGSSGADTSDLHQLRPSDRGVNSNRNNLNFGGVFGSGAAGRVNDGNDTVWYPGDWDAGHIARQQFYMDVRYDGSDSNTEDLIVAYGDPASDNQRLGDLGRMIEWHYAAPVDQFERRRNNIIDVNFQGNRNPFIDRPEFVWSVFMDQQNDSRIELAGGSNNPDGGSTLNVDHRVIRGSSAPTSQPITLNKSGLNGTYYSVTSSGAATSSVEGRFNSFRTGQTDSTEFVVELNASTTTAGITSGTITIDNLDITNGGGAGRGANDANDTINLSLAVLEHAQPSLTADSVVQSHQIDLGDFFIGSFYQPAAMVELHNLAAVAGSELTARLDLDAINETDAANKFNFANELFSDLAAGQSASLSIDAIADSLGQYLADYEFLVSDEDIVGGADSTLNLSLSFEVVAHVGDFSLSGNVDSMDTNFYTGQLGQTVTIDSEFRELDLDGDGVITLADHDLHVTTLVETSIGTQGTLIGDVNLDGRVDVLIDAFTLIGGINGSGGSIGYAHGDFNADGTIDVTNDAFRLVSNLGNSLSPGAGAISNSAVPEPTCIPILAAATVAACARKRRFLSTKRYNPGTSSVSRALEIEDRTNGYHISSFNK